MEDFESTMLSNETSIRLLRMGKIDRALEHQVLDTKQLITTLAADNGDVFRFFTITRFLVKSGVSAPKGAKRLRISGLAFRYLMSHFEVAPTFVTSAARNYQPAGKSFHSPKLSRNMLQFWYVLPVRVQVNCTENQRSHASSTAGSNQMDPQHYLHLPDKEIDVRGSQIALVFLYDMNRKVTNSICINYQDGRWAKIIEEPERRLQESIERLGEVWAKENAFLVHLVLLSSVTRWWNNVLTSFNDQLIAHEKKLQRQMDSFNTDQADFNNEINKALHTMAAHLHRYGSEIEVLEDVVRNISNVYDRFVTINFVDPTKEDPTREYVMSGLDHIGSQLRSMNCFRRELESKTKNILALLFNNIQVSNDTILAANGRAMHQILNATRKEAELSRKLADQSQQIASEMQEDSVAMKTIARLTMFFLPGTSFAAILSMPFFTGNKWMTKANSIWLWIILSVPSTALAFVFYAYWKHRDLHRKRQPQVAQQGVQTDNSNSV